MKKGVKRIRGFQKEIETGQAVPSSEPLEKGHSKLATKLLSLWCHGLLSAVAIRELADLAIRDGAQHEELHVLAKGGNYGVHTGNCHRSLMSSFCRGISICKPFQVQAPLLDQKTTTQVWAGIDVFLPHLLFESLQSYPIFEQMFDRSKLENFWQKTLAKGDDRIKDHPCTLEKGWMKTTVPLFIHGDSVEFQSRDSMMVWSFGNALFDEGSLLSHLLLAAVPKSCSVEETWNPVWKWLRWSFEALGKGKHPVCDPSGLPLKKGSQFFEKRGQDLSPQKLKPIIWFICGDHEHFSNNLKLAHWRHKDCCWACNATQSDGPRPYQNLDWELFDCCDTALEKGKPASHALFEVPGVTSRMVRHDSLHVLYTKGLYAHILGSTLHYLSYYDPPHTHQRMQPAERLGVIFGQVQKEYTLKKVECRLTNLHLKMFTNPKSPWAGWAFLGCKGAESKHLAPCLLPVLKAVLDNSREERPHMVQCLENLARLTDMLDNCDLFLSAEEFDAFFGLVHVALQSLQGFREAIVSYCERVPQFSSLGLGSILHQLQGTCMHFVGKVARLGHSISFGVRTTRISQKLACKYQVLMHMLLTRDGINLETPQEDEP